MPEEKQKPVSTYRPSPEERKELSFVYERWQTMKNARGTEENEWQKDDEQYEMSGPRRMLEDWKADLRLPDTSAAILSALSEMVDQTPGISYFPREMSDQKRADKFNAAWKYTWEKGQGNVELLDHLLQSAIYGTAIGKEYYRHEMSDIKEVETWEEGEDGHPMPIPKTWKKQSRVSYDDVHFKSIHIRNFWVDEKATSIENASDCVEIELFDEDTFHQRFDDVYPNAKLVKGGVAVEYDWYKKNLEDAIEVIYYTNCRRDMLTICSNGILLTKVDNPNPYNHKELPYVRSVFIPKPRSFYGLGIPRLVRSLQDEKNTVRNMRLDKEKLAINTIVVVDDKIELDDDDTLSEPNKVIKGPPGSIEFKQAPASNPSAYKEEELLREDIIRSTGVDPRLQTLGGAGDTATEIAILKESSMKRIRLTLRILEWTALYRLGCLRLKNFLQFYSVPKMIKIMGEDGAIEEKTEYPSIRMESEEGIKYESFKETDLRGEYDVIIVPGSTLPISEALESQKSINLFDRLKGHPDVNQRKLVEDLIRAHKKNPADVLTKQEEPPMGSSPTRGPGGVPPMPGNGMGNQGMAPQVQNKDVLPAQQVSGVNMPQ